MELLSKFIAVLLIIFLSPLFIVISVIIYIDDGRPILFRQKRIGKKNKHFYIFKFRTMRVGTGDVATHLFDNSSAITFCGRFLRKWSLDEIPQLFNIIKGDMVFIGPRPALHNQYDLINLRKENNLDSLKPGLTGLAQINGRDNITIEDKVSLELSYLNEMSLILNLKIIFKTLLQLILPKNVSH